jgi:hypothetical protein
MSKQLKVIATVNMPASPGLRQLQSTAQARAANLLVAQSVSQFR